jgi:hypothetical protein
VESQQGQFLDVDRANECPVAGEERLRGDGGRRLRRVVGVPEQVLVAVEAQRRPSVARVSRPVRPSAAARFHQIREACRDVQTNGRQMGSEETLATDLPD